METTIKPGLNAGVREGKTCPASEKTPSMLLVEPNGVGQLYIK